MSAVEYGTKRADGILRWADGDGELRIGDDYYPASDLPSLRVVIARHARNGGKTTLVQRSVTYGEPVDVLPELPTKPGVYLPYANHAEDDTPNVWLLKRGGLWLEFPNCNNAMSRVLQVEDVIRRLDTLTFLGTGTAEQKVTK